MQLPKGAISGCVNSKWIDFDGWVVRHLGDYYKFDFSELHLYQVLFLRDLLLDRLLIHSICQEVRTLNASLRVFGCRSVLITAVIQKNGQSSDICATINAVEVLEARIIQDNVVLVFLNLSGWLEIQIVKLVII